MKIIILIILLLNLLVLLGVFIKNYLFIIVRGTSMYPTLKDGEIRLIERRKFNITKGHIYVFKSPDGKYVVKRLDHNVGQYCFFLGDNKDDSIDSRTYGYVNANKIIGKLIIKEKGKN